MVVFKIFLNNNIMTYSEDFIINIINYYNKNNITKTELSKMFNISIPTINRWLKGIFPVNIRKSKISNYTNIIKDYVIKNVFTSYKDIYKYINNKISFGSIYNILKTNNITYKRVYRRETYKTKEQILHSKKEFKNNSHISDFLNAISIDECHFNDVMYYNRAYSLKNDKIIDYRKHKSNKNKKSLLLAISNNNILNYIIVDGSITSNIFKNFISLFTNKTIILDNAPIHHSKIVKELANNLNNHLLFIPPYTPEYNPIEYIFSKIKNNYRKLEHNNITKDIEDTIKLITMSDCFNSFNKCNTDIFNQ